MPIECQLMVGKLKQEKIGKLCVNDDNRWRPA